MGSEEVAVAPYPVSELKAGKEMGADDGETISTKEPVKDGETKKDGPTTEEEKAATKVQSLARGKAARAGAKGGEATPSGATDDAKPATDAEQSPSIDVEAFKVALVKAGSKLSDEDLVAEFKRLDTDGSGGLSQEELATAIKAQDVEMMAAEAVEKTGGAEGEAAKVEAAAAPADEAGEAGKKEEAAPESPAVDRRKNSLSLMGGLDDMMAMLSVATEGAKKANENADAAGETAKKADEKLARQRRKSRDLELMVFDGLDMKDTDALRKKFNEFDTDGSGSIDMTELRDILGKCGKKASDAHIKKLIARFDDNGDHVLQFEEFRKMIGEWDSILEEFNDEDERLKAALAAAEKKPYVPSNRMTPEQMEARRKMEEQIAMEEAGKGSSTPMGLSRNSSLGVITSATPGRSRRTSRDLIDPGSGIAEEGAPGVASLAGSGARAAKSIRSTSGELPEP